MANESKSSSLRSQIEKLKVDSPRNQDSAFTGIEEFVPGLLKEIRNGLPLPKTDLKSVASAKNAVQDISKKLDELKAYQDRVRALRDLLLQKKHTLTASARAELEALSDQLDDFEEH